MYIIMVYMLEKLFHNVDLYIDLTSFIDNMQNVWFKGKDIARILGCADPSRAVRRHVDPEDKFQRGGQISLPFVNTPGGKQQAIFN